MSLQSKQKWFSMNVGWGQDLVGDDSPWLNQDPIVVGNAKKLNRPTTKAKMSLAGIILFIKSNYRLVRFHKFFLFILILT